MNNNSQKSLLELAIMIVEEAEGPVAINEILAKAIELKGIDDPKGEKRTQLYVDITTSSKFVYMGNSEWDLKANQSLEQYAKDGADFNEGIADDEEEIEVSASDFDTEDGDESTGSEDDEEQVEEEITFSEKNPYADDNDMEEDDIDPSEFDDIRDNPDEDDFDEDKYGDIMDSYEDLYDK